MKLFSVLTTLFIVTIQLATAQQCGNSGCCSGDFKNCVTWCGRGGADACLSCNQDVHWICGQQNNCKPKWHDCTRNKNSCCDGLTCVDVNSHYSQCRYVEPSAPPECVHCDDVETPWMKKNDQDCTSSKLIDRKCNKDERWSSNRYCQLSCFNKGNGYSGNVCCNSPAPTSAPVTPAPVTKAPVVSSAPITLPPVVITNAPSATSSSAPSLATSSSPSKVASVSPTISASSSPSTAQPSLSPTVSPSITATVSPTIETEAPVTSPPVSSNSNEESTNGGAWWL